MILTRLRRNAVQHAASASTWDWTPTQMRSRAPPRKEFGEHFGLTQRSRTFGRKYHACLLRANLHDLTSAQPAGMSQALGAPPQNADRAEYGAGERIS
jgi:hypothetical protein